MKILLFGEPGSGKGTVANIIKENIFDIIHFSTGDYLRTELEKNTPHIQLWKNHIDTGLLLPDKIINPIVEKFVHTYHHKNYILDGYPRSFSQLKFLNQCIKSSDSTFNLVIFAKCNRKIQIQRMSGRLTCIKCGQVYNKFFLPPQEENKCNKCHSQLIKRADDQDYIIRERIKKHEEIEKLLFPEIKKIGNNINIDTSYGLDSIRQQVLSTLKK
jgi:adenylate kinase